MVSKKTANVVRFEEVNDRSYLKKKKKKKSSTGSDDSDSGSAIYCIVFSLYTCFNSH